MNEADDLEIRRKRLRFRSWHRGTREMDLLIGRFADTHLDGFDATQIARFEGLLNQEDPDLYNWMTGRAAPPAAQDHDVMQLLKNFKFHQAID
jgi:antitoxin CptB